jgi:hypothetical protein
MELFGNHFIGPCFWGVVHNFPLVFGFDAFDTRNSHRE